MSLRQRPRRLRKTESIRYLVRENRVGAEDLILPYFLAEGSGVREEISTMPGQFRLSLDCLEEELFQVVKLGARGIALFPVVKEEDKNESASYSYDENCFYLKGISRLKKTFPELVLFTDVAMDPYSTHGHDGLFDEKSREIINDPTLEILGKMALAQAKAGADFIGPSDMMDGRVGYLRKILDENGFENVGIMSYCAKYASAFYGPFRDALDSAPKFGDKKTYQMDWANSREALRELDLDISEGADIILLKPGLCYLDLLVKMRERTHLPLAIYNVSGEYAMIKAASKNGMINEKMAVEEILTAFKRAGADLIISYFAKDYLIGLGQ